MNATEQSQDGPASKYAVKSENSNSGAGVGMSSGAELVPKLDSDTGSDAVAKEQAGKPRSPRRMMSSLAEIKRGYSVADKDGDGDIDQVSILV